MNCYKGMSHFCITKPRMLTNYSQTNCILLACKHMHVKKNKTLLPKSRFGCESKGMNLNGHFNDHSMNCKLIPIMWWHQMQHQQTKLQRVTQHYYHSESAFQKDWRETRCLFYRMVPGNRSWDFRFGSPVPLVLLNQYIDAFQTSKTANVCFKALIWWLMFRSQILFAFALLLVHYWGWLTANRFL